ncbi:MAG: sodium:solute symporter family protein [Bacteroidota bacterium]|nr:sodium:solute symporter family protein [Bacteroidota bacterium]MDP4232672.1 sodium:solute symporter family protein [Bacteroidota bacterium]MDP4243195.1 sodium:solute symporter family protein [Bacteroidota bacterium]MDP4288407.1 sodium:solute symporter family protein [Bacteroidota bacterium]
MHLLGLHIIDWSIIALYLGALIAIGRWTQRRIRTTKDFFQADRSFGRAMMGFLNFGNMVSADQAAGVTREIYRQGLQGVWFQNLVLFITPFYWFTSVLQRRARYLAPGDIYQHRFESRFLSGLFAVYLLLAAIYGSSIGYLITGKTMQAVMIKPASEYTLADQRQVREFNEMRVLEERAKSTPLPDSVKIRLELLHAEEKAGTITGTISYLDLTTFYIIYGLVTAAYVIMGGLFAAAYTDVLQGIMILFLSVILIPVGLMRLGGFAGLHSRVADDMFRLFGTGAGSEYTWWFVATMVLVNLIGLAPRSFTIGGAAKDDRSARVGMITGAFVKRLVMIGWAFTGLIALGLYGGKLSDATYVWGTMTGDLLGTGFIGIMIASVLAANMASKASSSLEWSAAFTKNILLPARPQTSERAQVFVGRMVIFIVLMGGIGFAYVVNDIFVVFKYVLSIGTIIGPSIWLVYFWRRLTTKAVIVQMLLSIMVTVVVPNVIPAIPSLRTSPALTVMTQGREERHAVRAKTEDVAAGRAMMVGEEITRIDREEPTGIYFETIGPPTGSSVREGKGLFRFQLWVIGLTGVDLRTCSKAGLSAMSFLFDIFFPFFVLFIVSLFTRPNSERVLREFYARVHTPAHADPELDAIEVRRRIEDPELANRDKMFPGTNWEFWTLTKQDMIGFGLCWLGVGGIILLYLLLMRIGS